MKTEEIEDMVRFVRGTILPPLRNNMSSISVQQFFKAAKLFTLIAFITNGPSTRSSV
jgi:hypothetical protein